ncbi:MAG TPA: hypothetical protein VFU76_08850, partial [Terriglobales bacterium]|nr:hypothetical protein [Terriglobales bacterium]
FNPHVRHAKKMKQFERATFIGKQMNKDKALQVKYRWVPIIGTTRDGRPKIFTPRLRPGVTVKEGGQAMLRAAEGLAKTIASQLHAK